MTRENLLSVLDIAKELNTGRATAKFLLKRFKKWMPSELINGQRLYPATIIKTLFIIQENLDMGMLPGDIEAKLDAMETTDPGDLLNHFEKTSGNEDIRLSNDGLTLLKSLFNDIGDQQKRIAVAHEKRAAAEERKAVAIEKRAEAEEKKAAAMNNIAHALQEMNQLRASEPVTQQIVHEAAAIVADDEIDEDGASIQIETDQVENKAAEHEQASVSTVDGDLSGEVELDDLSLLIDDESAADLLSEDDVQLDDLSLLLDDDSQDDGDTPEEEPVSETQLDQLDDLSLLIDADENPVEPQPEEEKDTTDPDDKIDGEPPVELDDLSKLIDQQEDSDADRPSEDMDDLSKLIDMPSSETEPASEADTSKNETGETSSQDDVQMDDLSLLIDESQTAEDTNDPEQDEAVKPDEMDDLSKLIDTPPSKETEPIDEDTIPGDENTEQPAEPDTEEAEASPEITLDVTPEEDLEKYKAEVMNIILGFKTDGRSVEDTTQILNKNNVKTLSGKPEWSQKAISQVYQFIESAE